MRSSEKLREHNLRGLLGVPTTDDSEYANHGVQQKGQTNLHTTGGAEATEVEASVDVNCTENELVQMQGSMSINRTSSSAVSAVSSVVAGSREAARVAVLIRM